MKQLYEATLAYKRRLDLAIVVYTAQLCASIKPVMKYVDTVSLWIWNGEDILKVSVSSKTHRFLNLFSREA